MKKLLLSLFFLAGIVQAAQLKINPVTGRLDLVGSSSGTVSTGSFITNGSTLQSGAVFNVASGTVAGQLSVNGGILQGPNSILSFGNASPTYALDYKATSGYGLVYLAQFDGGTTTTIPLNVMNNSSVKSSHFANSGSGPSLYAEKFAATGYAAQFQAASGAGSTATYIVGTAGGGGLEITNTGGGSALTVDSGTVNFNTPSGVSVTYGLSYASATFTGLGNLSFQNTSDATFYQFVGSSNSTTTGDLACFSSSWSIVDCGAVGIISSNSLQPGTSIYTLISQAQNGFYGAYLTSGGVMFASGTLITNSSNLNYDYTNNVLFTGSLNTNGGVLTTSNSGINTTQNILINNAQGLIGLSNGQSNTSGINLQATSVAPTNFAGGLLGFNLAYSVALGSYSILNDFGTDYAGILIRRGGDIAFNGSNTQAANTFLTDAQLMANNHMYIKGTTGLVGIGMGATVPSLAQLQVMGSTTVANTFAASTTTAGPFNFYVSTRGPVGYEDIPSSGSLSSCGTGPSFIGGPNALTITAGTGATGCTYTFPTGVFTKTPICMASPEAFSITNAFSYSTTATAVTVTETGLGTGKVDIVCSGRD